MCVDMCVLCRYVCVFALNAVRQNSHKSTHFVEALTVELRTSLKKSYIL